MLKFSTHAWLFMYKVFPYALTISHNTSVTDGQTDGNHDNSSIVT